MTTVGPASPDEAQGFRGRQRGKTEREIVLEQMLLKASCGLELYVGMMEKYKLLLPLSIREDLEESSKMAIKSTKAFLRECQSVLEEDCEWVKPSKRKTEKRKPAA